MTKGQFMHYPKYNVSFSLLFDDAIGNKIPYKGIKEMEWKKTPTFDEVAEELSTHFAGINEFPKNKVHVEILKIEPLFKN